MSNVYQIFLMLGGLAVFMYGISIMGDSLETVGGEQVKTMFEKVSNNKLKGVGIGVGVTALIQSSSATTVMLVGFVNVGILSLTQATAIIMGSNIGTTITAQLSSLSGFGGINITAIMALIAFGGLILYVSGKKLRTKHIGVILLGLGMLFIGLKQMSSSMSSFAANPDGSPTAFAKFMLVSFKNPVLNILAGALFTAIIQSSSAATGVIIAFGASGIITFDTAMFIVLGTNIGTCVTAILSSVGTSINARRTAVIHLFFNLIGTVIISIPLLIFNSDLANFFTSISSNLPRAIANFHTVFNILTTAMLLPFTNGLVKLATVVVPDAPEEESVKTLTFLDKRILQTPTLAVGQSIKEVNHMADLAKRNLDKSISMILTQKLKNVDEFKETEKTINHLNIEITNYLITFSSLELSSKDDEKIGAMYHVVADIERIGDYAMNLYERTVHMKKHNLEFSDDAKSEIKKLHKRLLHMFDLSMTAFRTNDTSLLDLVDSDEDIIDKYKHKMQKHHVKRLSKKNCNVEAGSVYLELASQLERVGDHLQNIAYSIVPYETKVEMGDIR